MLEKPAKVETTSGLTFDFKQGVAEEQISQLITFASKDPEIIRWTSDPKRFANYKAYEKWLKKERVIYTLADQEGNLQGIIWFGEERLPEKEYIREINPSDYGITFAIRTYGEARGKGIAKVFMNKALKKFLHSERYKETTANGIWLETSVENRSAVGLYEKGGWSQISNPDENKRILMVFENSGQFSF